MTVATPPTFSIKKGDLARPFQYQLTDGNGVVVDLTLATAVSFKMTQIDTVGVPKTVTGNATFVGPRTGGIVQYLPTGNDTDTVGRYHAEFTVTWPTNLPDTFPSDDNYIIIEVFAKV